MDQFYKPTGKSINGQLVLEEKIPDFNPSREGIFNFKSIVY